MTDQEWIDAEIANLTKRGKIIKWYITNFGGDEVEQRLIELFGISPSEYGHSFIIGCIQDPPSSTTPTQETG